MPDSFADSNLILYLLSHDEQKRMTSRQIVDRGCVVSVQVLNEVASVARRKHSLGWGAIGSFIDDLRPLITVTPLTIETHVAGRVLAARFGFNIYDALIVASAIEAKSETLFSEDMHHGLKIGDLTITNPFR